MQDQQTWLKDIFREFGQVSARRMFRGYGLFHEGLMIGLLDDDQLYLKADVQLAPRFEELSLPAFTYLKKGHPVQLSYYLAPDEIYDDPQEAARWASLSFAAALRSRKD